MTLLAISNLITPHKSTLEGKDIFSFVQWDGQWPEANTTTQKAARQLTINKVLAETGN